MAACGITQASIDDTENTQNIVPEQTDPDTPSEADSNTPEEVAKIHSSYTGYYIHKMLERDKARKGR
jgi:hypothetical protein